jgi:predicted CopG family antitoxin
MSEPTKGVRLGKEVWKKLLKIKYDNDFSNMSEVINYLLDNQKSKR